MFRSILAMFLICLSAPLTADDDLPLSVKQKVKAAFNCAVMQDTAEAEACLDEINSDLSGWKIHDEKDLITDETTIFLLLEFSGGQNSAEAKPTLSVVCQSSKMIISIDGNFETADQDNSIEVTFRIDQGDPFLRTWKKSSHGNGLISADPRDIYMLLSGQDLIARIPTKDHGDITPSWHIAGFEEAARWLDKYCPAYSHQVQIPN